MSTFKFVIEIIGWPSFIVSVAGMLGAVGFFAYSYTHGHGFWWCYWTSSGLGLILGFFSWWLLWRHLKREYGDPKPKHLKAVK